MRGHATATNTQRTRYARGGAYPVVPVHLTYAALALLVSDDLARILHDKLAGSGSVRRGEMLSCEVHRSAAQKWQEI